ncbi:uncharacterized protein [Procambarus clarkii]|uniref:uncharacterized protein n=1 Tax=Procambarus clarkii TaxID=6728 RepID=UPI003743D1D5
MKNDAETDVDKRTERCQEGEGQRRWRLLFPASCTLAYHQKLLWTVTLGREHRKFEPLLKEGVNRPYLTILDPEFILDDQRFVWAKRHLIKGEARSQVVALVRGEVPEKVFITGAGYRHVAKYVEEPIICLKCCRWGHKSWSCQNDPRCRFCGKSHLSNVCRNRLNLGEKIVPRCCNCGGVHNASSAVCSKRPSMGVIRPVNVTEQARALTQTPGAQQNSLPQTAPVNRTNAWVKESPLLRQAQATSSHATTQDSGSDSVTVSEVATVAQKEGHNNMAKEVWAELRKVGEFLQNLGQRIESIEAKLNVQEVKEIHKTVKENQDIVVEGNNEILSAEMKESEVCVNDGSRSERKNPIITHKMKESFGPIMDISGLKKSLENRNVAFTGELGRRWEMLCQVWLSFSEFIGNDLGSELINNGSP